MVNDYDKFAKERQEELLKGEKKPHRFSEKPMMKSMLSSLNGKKVLMLGCGTGEESVLLKSFGKLLRDYRIKAGLTQEKLSEQLGISLKYISRIENGNNGVKTQTQIKYMNILGISPNTLYKEFITNPNIKESVELSERIDNLSEEKKLLVSSIIDLVEKF